jgi:Tfp pilus assembly protein PilF
MAPGRPDAGISRNDPCPCGSGKKYKKCCLGKGPAPPPPPRSRGGPASGGGAAGAAADDRTLLRQAREHQRAGQLKPARRKLEEVLRRRPKDAVALNALAQVLGRLDRTREAIGLARRSVAAQPKRAPSHVTLADLLLTIGEHEEAERAARAAVALDAGYTSAWLMLATCHARMHRLDDAVAAVGKVLAAHPDDPDATIALARLEGRRGDLDAARARLVALAARDLEPAVRPPALQALGEVLDKRGEYDEAFEAFASSGRLRLDSEPARAIDVEEAFDAVTRHTTGHTRARLGRWSADDFDDLPFTPAFLVGFPRSGTTMTEQILAAHPDVVSTDEKPILQVVGNALGARFSGAEPASDLAGLERDEIVEFRAVYRRESEATLERELTGGVFVDKLPLNIIYAGMINAIFPDARLIVALRDPRDVCLSCLMQQFRLNAAMKCFLDLETTARLYAHVMRGWLRVRDALTVPYVEVRYEDTVTDLEPQAARILDGLGLAWNPEVLSFHEKARRRAISTPSFAAVAEPVHTRAMGRWRNYRRHVEPVMPHLRPFLEAFGYEEPPGGDAVR